MPCGPAICVSLLHHSLHHLAVLHSNLHTADPEMETPVAVCTSSYSSFKQRLQFEDTATSIRNSWCSSNLCVLSRSGYFSGVTSAFDPVVHLALGDVASGSCQPQSKVCVFLKWSNWSVRPKCSSVPWHNRRGAAPRGGNCIVCCTTGVEEGATNPQNTTNKLWLAYVRQWLRQSAWEYFGHSFRIEAATAAQTCKIQLFNHWQMV